MPEHLPLPFGRQGRAVRPRHADLSARQAVSRLAQAAGVITVADAAVGLDALGAFTGKTICKPIGVAQALFTEHQVAAAHRVVAAETLLRQDLAIDLLR